MDLAGKAGVPYSTFYRAKKGRTILPVYEQKIREALQQAMTEKTVLSNDKPSGASLRELLAQLSMSPDREVILRSVTLDHSGASHVEIKEVVIKPKST